MVVVVHLVRYLAFMMAGMVGQAAALDHKMRVDFQREVLGLEILHLQPHLKVITVEMVNLVQPQQGAAAVLMQ